MRAGAVLRPGEASSLCLAHVPTITKNTRARAYNHLEMYLISFLSASVSHIRGDIFLVPAGAYFAASVFMAVCARENSCMIEERLRNAPGLWDLTN